MKKIFLILLSTFASPSMLAMEPAEQKDAVAISQEEQDKLGRELIDAIRRNRKKEAIQLINAGANLNYIERHEGEYYRTPLMEAIASSEYGDLEVINTLIEKKADVNVVDALGHNALTTSFWFTSNEIIELLIDAGIDIYYTYEGGTVLFDYAQNGHIEPMKPILNAATKLSLIQKSSIKNWLLVDNTLRKEKRAVHKDLRNLIAQKIIESLANDIRENVVGTGALLFIKHYKDEQDEQIVRCRVLIEQYLDLDFLKKRVRAQLTK